MLEWARSVDPGHVRFCEAMAAEWEARGTPNPLDDAPQLWPENGPTWRAYQDLLLWADGMGGLNPGVLDRFFEAGNPGAALDPGERRRVRADLAYLIGEDRRLQAEEMRESADRAKRGVPPRHRDRRRRSRQRADDDDRVS